MPNLIGLASILVALSFFVSALIGIYSLIKIPNQDNRFLFAGFWRRALAGIIDGIVLMIFTMVPATLLGLLFGFLFVGSLSPRDMEIMGQGIGGGVGALIGWLYFAKMESSRHQATLGKKLLGLRVVDTQGRPINFAQATGRHFAKVLSLLTFYVGVYMMGWTKQKQALHDKIAGCLVLRRGAPAPVAQSAQARQAAALADRDRLDKALSKPPVSSVPPRKPAPTTMSDRILARLEAGQGNSR